jgi:release factor glutamine methyltransferase
VSAASPEKGDTAGVAGPTVAESLLTATGRIAAAGSASSRLDAELLLAHVLGVRREALYGAPERRLSAAQAAQYELLVARRERREPVAYIVGRRAFRTIQVDVTPSAIVPRPDTETLVEVALQELRRSTKRQPLALDVGTGSGCIALALVAEHPGVRLAATDIDPAAAELARRNAQRLGMPERVEVLTGDLFSPLPPGVRFDLIVSNPPYIAEGEIDDLQEEIRRHEPRQALVSGPTGLEFYQRLVPGALPWLEPGGLLAVEIHEGRAAEVQEIFRATERYEEVRVTTDLGGAPRVVSGRERA